MCCGQRDGGQVMVARYGARERWRRVDWRKRTVLISSRSLSSQRLRGGALALRHMSGQQAARSNLVADPCHVGDQTILNMNKCGAVYMFPPSVNRRRPIFQGRA